MLEKVETNLKPLWTKVEHGSPRMLLHQRHFKGQRHSITDGVMDVDLRTVVSDPIGGFKKQPMWAEAAYSILTNKRTNIQFSIKIDLPYSDTVMRTEMAIEVMADAWIGMRPVLEIFA